MIHNNEVETDNTDLSGTILKYKGDIYIKRDQVLLIILILSVTCVSLLFLVVNRG